MSTDQIIYCGQPLDASFNLIAYLKTIFVTLSQYTIGLATTLKNTGVQVLNGILSINNSNSSALQVWNGTTNTLNVDTTNNTVSAGNLSSSGNFTQLGTGTFTTGTGNITLNGDVTVVSGKTFTTNSATITNNLNAGSGVINTTLSVNGVDFATAIGSKVNRSGDTMTGALSVPGLTVSNLSTIGIVHNNAAGVLSTGLVKTSDLDNGTNLIIPDSNLATISTAGKVANSALPTTITASLIGNVTGNVTGSASNNVLKAGDTMTGPLVTTGLTVNGLSVAGLVHNNASGVLSTSLLKTTDLDNGTNLIIPDSNLATISTAGKVANSALPTTITASLIGNVTGSASNNVLKAGDTMSGPLTTTGLTVSNLSTAGLVHNNGSGLLSTGLLKTADLDNATNLIIPDSNLATLTTAGKIANSALPATITATFIGNITGSASNNVLKSGDTMSGPLTTTGLTVSGLATVGLVHNNASGLLSTSLLKTADLDNGTNLIIPDSNLATISTAGKVANSATTATSANTVSTIVARDTAGNFSAGTITANLNGSASLNVLKTGDTMTGILNNIPPHNTGAIFISPTDDSITGTAFDQSTVMFKVYDPNIFKPSIYPNSFSLDLGGNIYMKGSLTMGGDLLNNHQLVIAYYDAHAMKIDTGRNIDVLYLQSNGSLTRIGGALEVSGTDVLAAINGKVSQSVYDSKMTTLDSEITTNVNNITANTNKINTNITNIATNTSNITTKVAKAGDTMTGDLIINTAASLNSLVVKDSTVPIFRVNTNSHNVIMDNYAALLLTGGNSWGSVWGNYNSEAYGDSLNVGYNFYVDGTGSNAQYNITNRAFGNTNIQNAWGFIDFQADNAPQSITMAISSPVIGTVSSTSTFSVGMRFNLDGSGTLPTFNRTIYSHTTSLYVSNIINSTTFNFKDYYIINSTNNQIYWTIASTNYSATVGGSKIIGPTLAYYTQLALNSIGPGGFTVSLNASTQLFTISNAAAFSLTFGTNTTNSIAATLGFTNVNTTAATSTTGTITNNLNATTASTGTLYVIRAPPISVRISSGGSLTTYDANNNPRNYLDNGSGDAIIARTLSVNGTDFATAVAPISGKVNRAGDTMTGLLSLNNGLFMNNFKPKLIALYDTVSSGVDQTNHQFYGFGMDAATLRYQVDTTASNHIFYAATSATNSNSLFTIQGNGLVKTPYNILDDTTGKIILPNTGAYCMKDSAGNSNNLITLDTGGTMYIGAPSSAGVTAGDLYISSRTGRTIILTNNVAANGNITVNNKSITVYSPSNTITGISGGVGMLTLSTNTLQATNPSVIRWNVGLSNNETGTGNTGADFNIYGYSDTGAFLNNPFRITRSTGAVKTGYNTLDDGLGNISTAGNVNIAQNKQLQSVFNTVASGISNIQIGATADLYGYAGIAIGTPPSTTFWPLSISGRAGASAGANGTGAVFGAFYVTADSQVKTRSNTLDIGDGTGNATITGLATLGSISTTGNISQTGSTTFSTGTGVISLNGATTINTTNTNALKIWNGTNTALNVNTSTNAVTTKNNTVDDGGGNTILKTLSLSPNTYSTGTVGTGGVSSTTITGANLATFTSAMIGGLIVVANGTKGFITAYTSTTLTVATAITIAAGTNYVIYYGGLQSDAASGNTSINSNTFITGGTTITSSNANALKVWDGTTTSFNVNTLTAAVSTKNNTFDDGGGNTAISGSLTAGTSMKLSSLSTAGVIHNNTSGVFSSSLIVNGDVDPAAAIVDTKLATIQTAGKVLNSATTATSSTVSNAIVLRDANGDFNTHSVNLSGYLTSNTIALSTSTYAVGTAGTGGVGSYIITASASPTVTWSSSMIGGIIDIAGYQAYITNVNTVASPMTLTVDLFLTISNGTSYVIYYGGFQSHVGGGQNQTCMNLLRVTGQTTINNDLIVTGSLKCTGFTPSTIHLFPPSTSTLDNGWTSSSGATVSISSYFVRFYVTTPNINNWLAVNTSPTNYPAGLYKIDYDEEVTTDRCIYTLSDASHLITIATGIDQYYGGGVIACHRSFYYRVPSSGSIKLTWTVTGKNASSTNYHLALLNNVTLTQVSA